jgi:hypothetical protein
MEDKPGEADRCGEVAGVALVVAQSIAHVIATFGFGICDSIVFGPCLSPFDLDRSNGISDVISTTVIAAAVLGAVVLGAGRFPRALAAFGLAVTLLLIDVDDTLHTRENVTSLQGLVVVGSILTAAVFMILVAVAVPDDARRHLLIGMLSSHSMPRSRIGTTS